MSFDIDETVSAVAAAMRAKHPGSRRTPGLAFEQSVKAISRDRDVADLIARKRAGPMSFVDDRGGVTVVLPAGVRGA